MEDSSERDEWVMSVVAGALQCPATEREGYLRNTCGNDSQLYQEVAETIEWEARMGSFLLHPMIAFKHFARAFQVGQVISERFELIREIGEGGMGNEPGISFPSGITTGAQTLQAYAPTVRIFTPAAEGREHIAPSTALSPNKKGLFSPCPVQGTSPHVIWSS